MHTVKTDSLLSEEEEAFSMWDLYHCSTCALYMFAPPLGLNYIPQFYTSQENYLKIKEDMNLISVTMIYVMLIHISFWCTFKMIGVYLNSADHTRMPKSEDGPLKPRDLQDALLVHLSEYVS